MGASLTVRQRAVYEYICQRLDRSETSPTVREIGEHLSIRSPNGVVCHLRALERKGLIRRQANKCRAIQVSRRIEEPESSVVDMKMRPPAIHRATLVGSLNENAAEIQSEVGCNIVFYCDTLFKDWTIVSGDILVIESSVGGPPCWVELVREESGRHAIRSVAESRPKDADHFNAGGHAQGIVPIRSRVAERK